MRIMIKGGVWKNTEDEILKAAVMKYGKNQWARISSLLVRKSAKQCKARWYEWLDPSIKKTEWTREEDEKLLHLAKLMPTQWRTIAPIVGRTPSQCLERYEKLLDAACVKDENYEPNDDPRKLRPGEIDPNPESKPARPDPVDMDEDEKEMLSEARARLANTKGKKAKRKAREKQLEEARRLASLQKRRELKAAGIDNRQRKRKRKGIDYNAEIPFEKKPPAGFYDVVDEDRPVDQPHFPTTIEELEGKRRADVEAQLRKQDVAKNKIAQRQDAPSSVLQVNKLNDPETVRKRSKLMLPAPQITDHELEEIAKMGFASDLLAGSEAEGSGATRALLANYSQTPRQGMPPFRTPQRTPGGKADAIMMEAENLARLRESQTPLLGGDNPDLHPSDFSGVTPKRRDIQTPNPMATPLSTPGASGVTPRIGMTPSSDVFSSGMTPRGTPLRDELHINEDMDMPESLKHELRRQAELRRNLQSGLINLPQPRNEYQIVIQPLPQDNDDPEDMIEEDMSDRITREKAEEEARQQALLKKRSKVLQRELPRPPATSLELIRSSLVRTDEDKSSFVPPTVMEQADELVRRELLGLLEHDNAKYPLDDKVEKEKKKGGKRASNGKSVFVPEIEDFEEEEMKEADLLIREEIQFLRVAMRHENEPIDEFIKVHDACLEDMMYFPARGAYGLSSVAQNMEKLGSLQNEFENVKRRMDDETKKAQRLEQKIKLLTHGYQMRGGKLWTQAEATFKQMDTAATELECFEALQKQEQLAASSRINGLVEEIKKQKELEQNLQHRYGNLIKEQDKIERLFQEYRSQAKLKEEIKVRELDLLSATNQADDTPQNQDNAQPGSKEITVNGEQSSTANTDVNPSLAAVEEDKEVQLQGSNCKGLAAENADLFYKATGIDVMKADSSTDSMAVGLGGNAEISKEEMNGLDCDSNNLMSEIPKENEQIVDTISDQDSKADGIDEMKVDSTTDSMAVGLGGNAEISKEEMNGLDCDSNNLMTEIPKENEQIVDTISDQDSKADGIDEMKVDSITDSMAVGLGDNAEISKEEMNGLDCDSNNLMTEIPKESEQIVDTISDQDSKADGIDEMKVDSITDSMAVGLGDNAEISNVEINGLGCDSNLMSEIPKQMEQIVDTISDQDTKADGISSNGDDIIQHAADDLSKDDVSADENLLRKPTEMVDGVTDLVSETT